MFTKKSNSGSAIWTTTVYTVVGQIEIAVLSNRGKKNGLGEFWILPCPRILGSQNASKKWIVKKFD